MPYLSRRRVILAKIESSYGTLPDPAPAGTDAVLVRDLSITPLEADMVDRQLIRPFMGARPQLIANKRVQIKMTVELAGSGAAARLISVEVGHPRERVAAGRLDRCIGVAPGRSFGAGVVMMVVALMVVPGLRGRLRHAAPDQDSCGYKCKRRTRAGYIARRLLDIQH